VFERTCLCLRAQDGKSIISGWSDGKIRAFAPQSGKLLYVIHDAHSKAVTALAATSDSGRLVSGGEEGQVRVWRLTPGAQRLEASMKDHRGPVNAIRLRKDDSECVSASSDGSCIIWDLTTYKRRTSLFANTFFKSVAYHPDESQLVTTGTDRKVSITFRAKEDASMLKRMSCVCGLFHPSCGIWTGGHHLI
jgi:cilia- and flagella-associated protein 52